jgi:hypothetical protein
MRFTFLQQIHTHRDPRFNIQYHKRSRIHIRVRVSITTVSFNTYFLYLVTETQKNAGLTSLHPRDGIWAVSVVLVGLL